MFLVALSTLLCLAAAVASVVLPRPNDDDTDDEIDPSTQTLRLLLPYAEKLIKKERIRDSVKAKLPAAVKYLGSTFQTHHHNKDYFSSKNEFTAAKALFDCMFQLQNTGKYMLVWTVWDYLFVARLISEELDTRMKAANNTLRGMAKFAAPGSVQILDLTQYETLPAIAWERIHKMVTQELLLPKLVKHGIDCVAYFNNTKMAELDAVRRFTMIPNIARILRANMKYDALQTNFLDMYERIRIVKQSMKFLQKKSVLEYPLEYGRVVICEDELDELDVVMPCGLSAYWHLIDRGCCFAPEYNVLELAPSIRRSVTPMKEIEEVRPVHP